MAHGVPRTKASNSYKSMSTNEEKLTPKPLVCLTIQSSTGVINVKDEIVAEGDTVTLFNVDDPEHLKPPISIKVVRQLKDGIVELLITTNPKQ